MWLLLCGCVVAPVHVACGVWNAVWMKQHALSGLSVSSVTSVINTIRVFCHLSLCPTWRRRYQIQYHVPASSHRALIFHYQLRLGGGGLWERCRSWVLLRFRITSCIIVVGLCLITSVKEPQPPALQTNAPVISSRHHLSSVHTCIYLFF